jgi:hypothetical protein
LLDVTQQQTINHSQYGLDHTTAIEVDITRGDEYAAPGVRVSTGSNFMSYTDCVLKASIISRAHETEASHNVSISMPPVSSPSSSIEANPHLGHADIVSTVAQGAAV